MKVAFTTEMNCSRQHLWTFFEDEEKLKLWVPGLLELKITSPPPHGAGSTYVMKVKERGKLREYHGKNHIWEPARRIKETMWGMGAGIKAMHVDQRFHDRGDRCSLEYENEFEASGLFGRLLMPVLIRLGRAYCKSMNGKLKEVAEA